MTPDELRELAEEVLARPEYKDLDGRKAHALARAALKAARELERIGPCQHPSTHLDDGVSYCDTCGWYVPDAARRGERGGDGG